MYSGLWRDHESCCDGNSLMRFKMRQFAIEFAACRVTQSKFSHPSLRLEPPQQTRNGSAVTKGHEKLWVMGDGLATRNTNPKTLFSNFNSCSLFFIAFNFHLFRVARIAGVLVSARSAVSCLLRRHNRRLKLTAMRR